MDDSYFDACARVEAEHAAGRITLEQAELALKELRASVVEMALLSAALSDDDALH